MTVLFLVFCMLVTLISCGNQNTESKNNNSNISEKTEIAGIIFKSQLFTYDGTEHYLEITGSLPYGVEVEYENNGQVNVGEYKVTATVVDETGDSIVPNSMKTTLIIIKEGGNSSSGNDINTENTDEMKTKW